jgi:ABC-type multidrug transport system fused ATPase/permease subunit
MTRVIVLEKGTVVEDGDPKELLQNPKSIFKKMWEHQKGGFVS